MNESWQQIAVWAVLGLAAAIAIYSGISAWRALRKGECHSCAGCASNPKDQPVTPAKPQDRVLFLPADQLRLSLKSRKR